MEGSKEVTEEVLGPCKNEITKLLSTYQGHCQNKDVTLQKAVLKRIIRKIKENKANLDELKEFQDILNKLENEASN